MAHGVLRAMARDAGVDIRTDSAGTGDWHVGSAPDPRAVAEAKRRGYDISDLRARQASVQDYERFDLILAMDRANLRDLKRLRPGGDAPEPRLFLEYADLPDRDVPDPYHDGGFDHVLTLVETGCRGLVRELARSG